MSIGVWEGIALISSRLEWVENVCSTTWDRRVVTKKKEGPDVW